MASATTVTMADVDLREVEQFLYGEARLLDEWRLVEWLALFSADLIYWIPCNRDDIDPMQEISLVYDNRAHLEERLWRLQTNQAYAQEPRSRMRRLITNVQIDRVDREQIVVSSNFALYELRKGIQRAYVGRYEHHLNRTGNTFTISFKKAELLNNNEPIDNLTFIV